MRLCKEIEEPKKDYFLEKILGKFCNREGERERASRRYLVKVLLSTKMREKEEGVQDWGEG